MRLTIGYAIKCQGSWWQNAPPLRGQWGGRSNAAIFPTKEAAEKAFTRPGYYVDRLDGKYFKVVHLVQRPVEGSGRFVVRWRTSEGMEDYLNCNGQWGPFSEAMIHMSWDEAEDAIHEYWVDAELPGPAIVKLKARKPRFIPANLSMGLDGHILGVATGRILPGDLVEVATQGTVRARASGECPVPAPTLDYVPPSRIT